MSSDCGLHILYHFWGQEKTTVCPHALDIHLILSFSDCLFFDLAVAILSLEKKKIVPLDDVDIILIPRPHPYHPKVSSTHPNEEGLIHFSTCVMVGVEHYPTIQTGAQKVATTVTIAIYYTLVWPVSMSVSFSYLFRHLRLHFLLSLPVTTLVGCG